MKKPDDIDTVIFRENSEDIYVDVEWKAGLPEAGKVTEFLTERMGVKKIRFTENCGIDTKPAPQGDTKRPACKALQCIVDNDCNSVTLVHKDNIMKFTEGVFKSWGYEVARDEFGAELLDGDPWIQFRSSKTGKNVVVEDVIAGTTLQQILSRLVKYDVIATLNLNGGCLSGALTVEVGGVGIAPDANLSDSMAMFEATHGTASKYADQDKVSPGSLILSVEMVLRHTGWTEVAGLIIKGTSGVIAAKIVTYNLERLAGGATLLSCSEFGDATIIKM